MTRYKIFLTAALFVVVFFIVKTYACGCGGGSFGGYSSSVSPTVPPIAAPRPEFHIRWKAEDIIVTFKRHQLKVEELESITEAINRYPIFNSVNEAIKFNLPSFGMDEGVYIHTCSS